MSDQAQINAVKKALDYSIQIANYKTQLFTLTTQKYSPEPTPPVKAQIAAPMYPEIKTQVPFWTKELLPALFFWPWIIIYYFTEYSKKVEAEKERIRNTPEYRQKCALIDEDVQKRKAEADEEYRKQLEEYERVILPKYKREYNEWVQNHNKKVSELKDILASAEKELAAHYEETKIIPLQYRKIDALQFVYDMISTSDFTIHQAISSYDQKVQQHIGVSQLQVQQATLSQQIRTANAAEDAAWAAQQAADNIASQGAAIKDYFMSSECMRRKNIHRGKNKIIHPCEGCHLAPYCTSYK